MAVTRTLACPDCGGTFPWLFMNEDDWPTHCARCGSYMGVNDPPEIVPGAPAILTEKGKSVDQTYRAYEDASLRQAEIHDNPTLKVTNMKDNLRAGDVAAVAPQPSQEYKSAVEAMGGDSQGGYWQSNLQSTIAQTQNGRERGTGAVALKALQGGKGVEVPAASPTLKGNWGAG